MSVASDDPAEIWRIVSQPARRVERALLFRIFGEVQIVSGGPIDQAFSVIICVCVSPVWVMAVEIPSVWSRMSKNWEDLSVPTGARELVDVGDLE